MLSKLISIIGDAAVDQKIQTDLHIDYAKAFDFMHATANLRTN